MKEVHEYNSNKLLKVFRNITRSNKNISKITAMHYFNLEIVLSF